MSASPIPPDRPPGEILESWKEIASYLGKGVRTVVRWEKTEGLPVHRHQHERRASVFCYRSEIDVWWRNRRSDLDDPQPAPAQAPRRRVWLASTVLGAAVLGGIAWWLSSPQSPPAQFRPEALTTYPGEQYAPSFSPDGSHIVFIWSGTHHDNFDLYVQAVGAAEPKRLTDHPHLDFSPAWSPDGRWIAFLRRSPERHVALFVIPAIGGAERKLADLNLAHYMDATQLCWSLDSKLLVVPDSVQGEDGLYVMGVDSGERRRLTAAKFDREHLDPALSPDGESLAFRCDNVERVSEICLLAVDEKLQPIGQPAHLTSFGRRSTSPVWVAGGHDLVFSSGTFGSDTSLYRVAVFPARKRNEPVKQLTWGDEDLFSLASSRRGDMLAYTRKVADVNLWSVTWDPQTRRADEPSPVLSSNRADLEPDFSPDGTRITFTSDRSGSMEVWVAQADGSEARKLTSFGGHPVNMPRWSPDGKQLSFSGGESGREAIYLVSSQGGPSRVLAKLGHSPFWSRDGKWIYYSADIRDRAEVFKVSSSGGAPRQITTSGGSGPQESPDGRFIYYRALDGLWRISSSGGSPERVLVVDGLYSYAVARDGIFTIPILGTALPNDRRAVEFHWFKDGSVTQLMSTTKRPVRGLAVSPDGRRVLCALTDEVRMNLMLVRNLK